MKLDSERGTSTGGIVTMLTCPESIFRKEANITSEFVVLTMPHSKEYHTQNESFGLSITLIVGAQGFPLNRRVESPR